jgi:hypothetical protein
MSENIHGKKISPFTGWTYRDWQNIAKKILQNVYPHFSPGKALINFCGTRPSIYGAFSDSVEAFSRTFLLVGFWLFNRNNGKMQGIDGKEINWPETYREGLINGTNSGHPEYWGEISGKHQYMVEAASMAVSLYFSRHLIWDQLSKIEQNRVGNWFRHILQFPFQDKNWVLFNVIINSFLKSVAQKYNQDQIDFYLERYDSFYEAEGWYRDGIGPQYDYYDSWAMHTYPHLWSYMDPDIRRPELVQIFEERSRLFLEKYVYFFSSTASHPAFGRSILYRCAVTAAPIIGIWKNFSPLSAGLTRRLTSQSLKYFAEQNIFDDDGSLSLGWTSKFLPMVEKYSGPGSPLWFNKIFSAFLLSEEHEFWTAPEEPLPVEKGDYCITLKTPGFLVNGHQKTGHIQLINQGSDSYVNAATDWKTIASDYHYLKFSYSSHLFHDVGPTKDGFPFGNMISLYEESRGFSHRERIYPVYFDKKVAISFHYPFGEKFGMKRDSMIESAIIVKGDHQIRVHWVINPNRAYIYEGGYSMPYDDIAPKIERETDWINVVTERGQCCIHSLMGYDDLGISYSSGMNPQGKNSCLPYLKTSLPVMAQKIVACEIIARPLPFKVKKELSLVQNYKLEGRHFSIHFSDGSGVIIKLGSVELGEEKVKWEDVQFDDLSRSS